MKCENCGSIIEENKRFCRECGREVSSKTEALTGEHCPYCNSELTAGAKFCKGCGKLIEKEHMTKKKDKGLLGLIIILIIVVILSAATITYFYQNNMIDVNNEISVPKIEKEYQDKSENAEICTDNSAQDQQKENVSEKQYAYPIFKTATATSVLDAEGNNTYYADNVLDNKPDTAWVEGEEGSGYGTSITISAADNQKVQRIELLNGYSKSKELYEKNNRIKKVEISFGDGSSIRKELTDDYMEYNIITLDEPIICSHITFKIIDVYRGTQYDDTCISEIKLY